MKLFLTQIDGHEGPPIRAIDFDHARQLAFELEAEVIGEHFLTIKKGGFTEQDAERLCKAMSETY